MVVRLKKKHWAHTFCELPCRDIFGNHNWDYSPEKKCFTWYNRSYSGGNERRQYLEVGSHRHQIPIIEDRWGACRVWAVKLGMEYCVIYLFPFSEAAALVILNPFSTYQVKGPFPLNINMVFTWVYERTNVWLLVRFKTICNPCIY